MNSTRVDSGFMWSRDWRLTYSGDDYDGVEERPREGPLHHILVLRAVPAVRLDGPQQVLLEDLEAVPHVVCPVLLLQDLRLLEEVPQEVRHVGADVADVLLHLHTTITLYFVAQSVGLNQAEMQVWVIIVQITEQTLKC